MIASIATFVDDPAGSATFLKELVAQALAIDADLSITIFSPAPMIAADLAPFGGLFLPESELRADAAEDAKQVRALIGETAARLTISSIYGDVSWLAHDLRDNNVIADIFVLGPPSSWRIHWLRRRVIETLLLGAGTPLLLLPEGRRLTAIRRAILGWQPSAEAVRAAHDLVALAAPAAKVDIVTVGIEPAGGAPGPIAEFFARHGFDASRHWIEDERGEDRQLQDFALAAEADVLAVGGFGHPRIREILLGGVTRSLVSNPRVPILMAR